MNNNNHRQWRNIHFWALILLSFHNTDGNDEQLTICEVAERFDLTQSALSRQIKAMETAFGCTLLHRDYRGVSDLTAEALPLIPYLQQIVQATKGVQQIQSAVSQTEDSPHER